MFKIMADNGIDISAKQDGALYNVALNDQDFIIKGLGDEFAMSYVGLNVSVESGECVIHGRHIMSEETNTITLPANESGYLVLRIDLTKPVGQEALLFATPTLTHEEINWNGTIYDMPIATFTTGTIEVQQLEDVRVIKDKAFSGLIVEIGEYQYSYDGTILPAIPVDILKTIYENTQKGINQLLHWTLLGSDNYFNILTSDYIGGNYSIDIFVHNQFHCEYLWSDSTSDVVNPNIKELDLKMDLLWKNANVGASFPAQVIYLDLQKYKYIYIIHQQSTVNVAKTAGLFIKEGDYRLPTPTDTFQWREYRIRENLIDVQSAYGGNNTGIPVAFYGVK